MRESGLTAAVPRDPVLAAECLETQRHMEVVEWLKTEHGLGHGHANAIVAYVKAALAE